MYPIKDYGRHGKCQESKPGEAEEAAAVAAVVAMAEEGHFEIECLNDSMILQSSEEGIVSLTK